MCEFEKNVQRQIGNKLREIRITFGFSQKDLARSLDISHQQIQKYETGGDKVSTPRLSKIAKILNVPVTEFYDEVNYPINGREKRGLRRLMRECSKMDDKCLSALIGVATSINQTAH